ncbi:hypothetical protein pb186bvf_005552 [Paramecium bursaria]
MADYQTKYQEIKGSLSILMQQNNILKQQLKEAYEELNEKNILKEEWQLELQKVSEKIQNLQNENDCLIQELEQLDSKCQEQKNLINQYEETIRNHNMNSSNLTQRCDQYKNQNDAFQNKIYDLEGQVAQLKQQLQLKTNEFESASQLNESQTLKKLREIEMKYTQELDNARRSFQFEIEKLQTTIEQLELENHKYQQQFQNSQETIYELRETILQREKNLKQQREDLHKQLESSQQLHMDEIKKFQHIVDNQNALIQSYERVIEIEKHNDVPKHHIHYEDQIIELQNRNIILQNKIQEWAQKYEISVVQFNDEIKKLQSIIDDQRELIHQYERIKERDQKQFDKLWQIQNNEQKSQLQEILNQNNYFKNKINELQQQIDQQHQFQYNLNHGQQTFAPYYQPSITPSQPISVPESTSTRKKKERERVIEEPILQKPPKTFFSNNKLNSVPLEPPPHEKKKRSFYQIDQDDSMVKKRAEKEFQEEFLQKFQNVITRMEDKLGKIQSEFKMEPERKTNKRCN